MSSSYTVPFYYDFFTHKANLRGWLIFKRDQHMLYCYKIEFSFLQNKFSKHLLHNIIVACAILWNKIYQEFCCYSDLKDVTMRRRKRRVIILSTAVPELEFYNVIDGASCWSKFTLVTSDLDSHLFGSIKKS